MTVAIWLKHTGSDFTRHANERTVDDVYVE